MQLKGNADKFVEAMFSLVRSIKLESDRCCQLCGGVNEKELMIIVYVGQNKVVKMSEVAANIDVPQSTLTNMMDKLVAGRFLTRYNSQEDRRVVNVELDDAGREAYNIYQKQKHAVAKKVLAAFTEKEQGVLIGHIGKLAQAIELAK